MMTDGDLPPKAHTGLFAQVQLDPSRTCIFWNNEIGLPSDAMHEYGKELAPAS